MFCLHPHLLRPNKKLTRIKKGGHPTFTCKDKTVEKIEKICPRTCLYLSYLFGTSKSGYLQYNVRKKLINRQDVSWYFWNIVIMFFMKNGETCSDSVWLPSFGKRPRTHMVQDHCHPANFFIIYEVHSFFSIPVRLFLPFWDFLLCPLRINTPPWGTHSTKSY